MVALTTVLAKGVLAIIDQHHQTKVWGARLKEIGEKKFGVIWGWARPYPEARRVDFSRRSDTKL